MTVTDTLHQLLALQITLLVSVNVLDFGKVPAATPALTASTPRSIPLILLLLVATDVFQATQAFLSALDPATTLKIATATPSR